MRHDAECTCVVLRCASNTCLGAGGLVSRQHNAVVRKTHIYCSGCELHAINNPAREVVKAPVFTPGVLSVAGHFFDGFEQGEEIRLRDTCSTVWCKSLSFQSVTVLAHCNCTGPRLGTVWRQLAHHDSCIGIRMGVEKIACALHFSKFYTHFPELLVVLL